MKVRPGNFVRTADNNLGDNSDSSAWRNNENSGGNMRKLKRMLLRSVIALLSLVALPGAGKCQQPALKDPLLDSMTGQWVLSGGIMGKQTTHDVSVEWVLNHQFIHIHETSREKTAQGLPQYDADVYLGWDAAKSEYKMHWMDVYGGGFSSVGHAPRQEDTIALLFPSPDGDFHTTFTFDPKTKTWQWDMDSEQGGKLHPFARLRMTKEK